MSDKHMCDCNQGRLPCRCKEPAASPVIDYIDQQGSRIKVGVAYLFVFGMPGPDTTAIVIEDFHPDGTVSGWDVSFKFKVENIKPDRLWRPLKYKWDQKGERSAIIAYAGESALDLTP